MQYKVHQVVLSKADADAVNNGETVAKHSFSIDLFGTDSLVKKVISGMEQGFYSHTMTLRAYDLDEAFYVGNHRHNFPGAVQYHGPAQSVSVGDVLENEHGERFVVETFGFTQI